MSKAFTNEDDGGDALVPRLVSPLPPGTRNYLTPAGVARLRAELTALSDVERPQFLAATGEAGAKGAEAKERLLHIEQRMVYLERSLRTAEISPIPPPPHDVVRFGATVTVRDNSGEVSTYRIVGVDEADFDRGEVSWLSPVARALLNGRLGQQVRLQLPGGLRLLEISSIRYES